MKYDRLYNFISPVTGKLSLDKGYVLLGDKDGRSFTSPVLIDMRQDIIDLKRDIGYFEKLDYNKIWIGDFNKKPMPRTQIGVINLPPLAEAIFPNPVSGLSGDFKIPNPTYDYLSAFDWIMSGPFLPQIYATKYDMSGNPIGTDISSSLAMTQVRASQIMKRFDNANFIVGSSLVEFGWENPKMSLIPEQLKQLYGLGTTYTFTKAQSLGSLETGLLKNTVNDSKGILSKAIAGTDYVDFVDEPIGNFVVRPFPESKYIATIPLTIEELETSLTTLVGLKVAYEAFVTETNTEIAAINTKNVSQDAAISSTESIAAAAEETAGTALSTATAAEATASAAEATAVAAEASAVAVGAELETQIAVLAGVETISVLSSTLAFVGLSNSTKNQVEYIRGQTLNVKSKWYSADLNDEGHNAVGDFEFRFPSGYNSEDRGHGTLWFDSSGRKDKFIDYSSEPGLRIFSWDSGGDHIGYDDPIAPVHMGIFGYQNKYHVWPIPNPTPVYKGFIFRSEFHNEDSDKDDYRFPKNFGLYDAKRTISVVGEKHFGWDRLIRIFEYDYEYFTFYKKLNFKEDVDIEKQVNFLTTDGINMPAGSTSQRPVNPKIGCFRYNTDGGLEVYSGTNWMQLSAGGNSGTPIDIIGCPGLTIENLLNGKISLTLGSELQSLAAFDQLGLMSRIAKDTYTTREIIAGAGISIINGDGILGNPVININNTGVTANTYSYPTSITVNDQGRITDIISGNPTDELTTITLTGAVIGAGTETIDTFLNPNQFINQRNFNINWSNGGLAADFVKTNTLAEVFGANNPPSTYTEVIESGSGSNRRAWSIEYKLGSASTNNERSYSIKFTETTGGVLIPFSIKMFAGSLSTYFDTPIDMQDNSIINVRLPFLRYPIFGTEAATKDYVDDSTITTKNYAYNLFVDGKTYIDTSSSNTYAAAKNYADNIYISAKNYADTQDSANFNSLLNYANNKDNEVLTNAKTYTDNKTWTANKITDLDTTVKSYKLSDFASPTTNIDLNNQKFINSADATNPQDLVNMRTMKTYADSQDAIILSSAESYANSLISSNGNFIGDTKFSIQQADHGNWLLWQNGRILSRTTYATLWSLIVTAGLVSKGIFGNGDGSTTFTMGDICGRGIGIVGSSSSLTTRSLGDKIGSETTTQVPSHSHTINHVHGTSTSSSNSHTHGFSHTHSINHSHGSITTDTNTHSHSFGNNNVMFSNSGSDGGYTDYDGSGGASPYRIKTSFIATDTNTTSHSHSFTIPTFSGSTSSQSTTSTDSYSHTHTVDVPSYSGSSGSTGTSSVSIMNPTVYMNLFIYAK